MISETLDDLRDRTFLIWKESRQNQGLPCSVEDYVDIIRQPLQAEIEELKIEVYNLRDEDSCNIINIDVLASRINELVSTLNSYEKLVRFIRIFLVLYYLENDHYRVNYDSELNTLTKIARQRILLLLEQLNPQYLLGANLAKSFIPEDSEFINTFITLVKSSEPYLLQEWIGIKTGNSLDNGELEIPSI